MTRHPARRQMAVDLAIALVLGTASVLITAHFVDAGSSNDQPIDFYALTLVGLAFGALAVRRRWPLVALGITTVATSAYLLESFPYGPVLLAYFIAVYTVASLLSLRTGAISVAISLVVLLTHVLVHPNALGGPLEFVSGSAWAVVPFAIGTTVRLSRETAEARSAEAMRDRLYEERIRIAQEVHDIVGHGLAAIQMQADVALHVDEQQSPRTRTALESISQASSEAFEELRSTLDLISESRATSRGAATPGLHDIDELCERIRATGVDVDLIVEGDPGSVDPDPAIGLAIYRVLQESLTNVIRHGGAPEAEVRLMFGDDSLDLTIINPGRFSSEAVTGRGIRGMRERVEDLDGSLQAGATDEAFVVEAHLPLGDPR